LAVSRAIGDHSLASVGVVAEPEIRVHQIGKDMKCIVVASDGLWEYVSDQDAINIVSTNGSASRAAAALLDEAIAKWTKKGGGYQDDITIGVLYLPLWKEGVNANKPVAPVRALQTPPKPVVAPVIAPVVPPVAVPVPAKTEPPSAGETFIFKASAESDDSDGSDSGDIGSIALQASSDSGDIGSIALPASSLPDPSVSKPGFSSPRARAQSIAAMEADLSNLQQEFAPKPVAPIVRNRAVSRIQGPRSLRPLASFVTLDEESSEDEDEMLASMLMKAVESRRLVAGRKKEEDSAHYKGFSGMLGK